MQHLDEGTIHAWLDGALSQEEATRVETHVAECAQCAAVAAEARGFIAASSRILTALDDAPRGVIPIRTAAPRRFGPAWRAAAAVLVVALGTVAIRSTLRVEGPKAAESRAMDSTVAPVADQAPAAASVGNTAGEVAADRSIRPMVLRGQTSPSKTDVVRPAPSAPAPAPPPPAVEAQKSSVAMSRRLDKAAESPATVGSAATREAAQDYASTEQPLKVVRVDSTAVERRTVYEIAPNETVTLVEARAVNPTTALSSVVATGAATAAAGASAPAASDSRRVLAPSAPRANVAPAPIQATGFASSEQTIEWKDAATGRVLRLTGRFPPERLQEIRRRIERQRAVEKKQ